MSQGLLDSLGVGEMISFFGWTTGLISVAGSDNRLVNVVPDQLSSGSPARTRRRRRSALIGALALGLAIVVFQTTEPEPEAFAPALSTSTTAPDTRLLADLVPGFEGTLHAVEKSEGFKIVSWNSAQPLSQAPLTEGRPDELAFDAGGGLLGVTLRDDASRAGTLFVRNETDLVQMDLEVSSFAWHQTEPGLMAAVSQPSGSEQPELVTLSFEWTAGRRASVRSVTAMEPNDIVLSFGSWGFLIRRQEGPQNKILLIEENGDQVWERAAHWAYSSPTGDILLSFYSNETREFRAIRPTTPLAEQGTWFELPSLGVTAVAWSPRAEVAVVTYQGSGAESRLFIYDSGGKLLDELPLRWRVWGAEWSRNGRFVIMPGIDDGQHTVLFYDTEDERLTPVAFEGQVLTAVADN